MFKAKISHSELLRILDYDPETGIFTWKRRIDVRGRWNARWCGKPAGSIDPSTGYVKIMIDGVNYYGHRLAWLYATGNWPPHEIDHRFGRRATAKIHELREATRFQNGKNVKKHKRNSSGVKGVCWDKQTQKWRAFIMCDRKRINLGRFDRLEDAAAAYRAAAEKHHGEFARLA